MTLSSIVGRRAAAALLTAVIVELTAATAYIHFTLGGTLFLLNAFGYVALAVAYVAAATAPIPIVQRFGWLPRAGLAGYALLTIGAYLVMGPYFDLGWIAKGIELAIVGLVAVDLLAGQGSAARVVRAIEG
ncbi:MAG: hypothetical protein ACRDHD_09140 [Candidatus Limnocylindria bacterium]